jgi:pSer/pThr/pTyr-binding forkhead associated (FHA) protein
MSDPRLNSVHLEAPRRLLFRQARDALLAARGWQTIAGEAVNPSESSPSGPHTMVVQPDSAPPPGVKFWLIDKNCLYPLKMGLNTIGRAPENDVVVSDAYVSRRHCAVLVHAGDGCELHDIASKNGTFLNGRKLSGPTPLNIGDEIRMCDCQLVFMTKPDGAADGGHAHTQTGDE